MVLEPIEQPLPGSPRPPAPRRAPRRLSPPPLPEDFVRRPALQERLDASIDAGRVVLLAAGAGYGKSLLVSSWLEHRPERYAWVGLDALDGDGRQFASDVLSALRGAATGASAVALERLRPPPGFLDPQRFADSLLYALSGSDEPEERVLLVIDDVQHVADSTDATALLEFILRWAPRTLLVTLISRSDPPAVRRLAVEGRLEVLRQRDLAFTIEETGELLARCGLDVDPGPVGLLHAEVAGWPAGVRMAALSLRGSPDVAAAVAALTTHDQALSDYLVGEVLDTLSPELRSFVLRATVDDEVCASLLDHVLGGTTSAALLDACERQNVFLTASRDDHSRRWYRWHQVFANHMRHRLAYEDQSAAKAGERAAAQWWRAVDPMRAAHHLLAGGDSDGASELFAEQWLEVSLRGSAGAALSVADELPPTSGYGAEAELARTLSHVQSGRADQAVAALRRARTAAAALPGPARPRFEARAAVLHLFLLTDRSDLVTAVEAARALQATDVPRLDTDPATAAFVCLGLGMGEARLQADIPAAVRQLEQARRWSRFADLPVIDLMARAELCVPLIATGRLTDVEEHASAVLAEAAARGWQDLPLGMAKGFLGWLAYWRDKLPDARALLEEAYAETLETDWAGRGLITYFHALACLGETDLAAAREDHARARVLTLDGCMPPYWPGLMAEIASGIIALEGRLDEAVEVFSALPDGPRNRLSTCARADLLRRTGDVQQCLELLDDVPGRTHYPNVEATVGIIRALALEASGMADDAHRALEEALAAADTAGLVRPFAAHRAELPRLLADHQRRGTAHPELVARLLDDVHRELTQPPGPGRLTPREVGVLVYLPSPMSVAEIAAAHHVSVNTVKSQLASIYRKLDVDGRRAAVHRADELGLLAGNEERSSAS